MFRVTLKGDALHDDILRAIDRAIPFPLIFELVAGGILKALGANNTFVQKIFLYNGTLIMSKGLLWGNIVGLGFYFSQHYWGWIQLDPATYFVSEAPVYIDVFQIIFVNLFFLVISSLLLWIPSKIILRISPSKVLRFR